MLRLLLALLVALAGAFSASTAATGAATTSATAATYTYDESTVARVDVHQVATVEAGQPQLSDAREWSASPLVEGRGTSATSVGSVVATNTADDAARFVVDSAGNATLRAQGPNGWIQVSEHAAERMTQRGISIDALDATLSNPSFQYWHEGIWKTGYYDPATKIFAETVNDTVTTMINKASQNYINNLKAVTPP